MVKIRIPTPLRPLTGGKSEIETHASDIQAMIESLNGQFPGLKSRICDDSGEIRRFVNIYLNEEDIRFMKGKDTPLKDGDEVSIVPAIAGGCDPQGPSLVVPECASIIGKRPRPAGKEPVQGKGGCFLADAGRAGEMPGLGWAGGVEAGVGARGKDGVSAPSGREGAK